MTLTEKMVAVTEGEIKKLQENTFLNPEFIPLLKYACYECFLQGGFFVVNEQQKTQEK